MGLMERMQSEAKYAIYCFAVVEGDEEGLRRVKQFEKLGYDVEIEFITQEEKDRRERERKEWWEKNKHKFKKTIDK